MRIYRNIEDFIPIDNAVVTIGTFDGVHIGHQKILDVLKKCAKEIKGETVLLTFFPHPRMVLNKGDDNLRLINTIDEKIHRLAKNGIDHLIITPFTKEFSQQTPEEYIREILINKIGTKKIVIGYDHRFGIDRSGSFKDLLHFAPVFGYSVKEIAEQDINDVAVSSTKIREALIKGEVETANSYLGYPFELTGTVVKGKQIGRDIGFPTANINIPEKYKLIPAYGIYAVEVAIVKPEVDSSTEYTIEEDVFSYKGMGYIGTRPTINGTQRTIEVNLFDFSDDLYGKTLRVKILHFVRHDIRYNNLEDMKKQIMEDELKIRSLFKI
jgi:riboflavin kinase/FMN adenylyltransferase